MRGRIIGWDGLQASLAGVVALPGSTEYAQLRRPAVPLFDPVSPEAVVFCRTAADVSEALLFARLHDLAVVPRSGGHCFAGRSSTRGIIVDVGGLASVSMDGDQATVGAGTRLGGLYAALGQDGWTIPAGCGPDVGIAGLTLGGGLGIMGRRYGLTSDQLLSATVVLADGSIVFTDEHHDPDLFWALRGAGGGQFGIVTSFTFRTLLADPATVFHLEWPASDVVRVIRRWQDWAPDAPPEMAASLLVRIDGAGGDELQARPVAHVFGAMLASDAETATQLTTFVDGVGTDPVRSDRRHLALRDVKQYLSTLFEERPPHGGGQVAVRHHLHTSQFHDRRLPVDLIETLVAGLSSGLTPGQQRELDFTPWGGAYCAVAEESTAFAHRSQRFLLKQAVNLVARSAPGERSAATSWLRRSGAVTGPAGTGRVYPNFPEPGLADWQNAYHGKNFERLTQVKARYDPLEFFRFPQSIPASFA